MNSNVDDNEGRDTAASREISRRMMQGPIGAVFLVFIGMVLGSMLADSGLVGLVAWAIVCAIAFCGAAIIASAS